MINTSIFDRITIIGLGLIGSSIARAAYANKTARTIVACDVNEVSLAYAHKHEFIHHSTTDLKESVKDSQLVIIATPPSTLEMIAKTIAPALTENCIVMDVASVKQAAIDDIAPHMPKTVRYIPAHPIAGSEHTGVSAGRADLFEKKRVIVTPDDPNENLAMVNVVSFWKALGARVEAMPANVHDLIYAYVSHLPQLLAFAAAEPLEPYALQRETDPLLQKFLRLSHSSADLWIGIFILNKGNLLQALDRYLDVVAHVINEFAQAPDDAPVSKSDEVLARTALFPRIAASCLVTTVMEVEKKAGFPFARYAGTGFADFTYPASKPPEGDMESISSQYQEVSAILSAYMERLKAFRAAIDAGEDLFE